MLSPRRKLLPLAILSTILLLLLYYNSSSPTASPTPSPKKMPSQKPLRLAILECDMPQPQTRAKYGNYTGVFTALLDAAAQTFTPPQSLANTLTISAHDVVNDLNSYPSLDDVDALLLTGSRHTAFENDPWILKLVEFTKQAIDSHRVKVVGICFGHQIIARALGAGVEKSPKGWEVAVTEVDLTDKGKEIFGLNKLRIHQMHRDIVHNFPADAIPLGTNAFCPVQGMYKPGQYITVQGHPEFTEDIITEVLVNRHKAGIFSDEVYEEGMKRAPIPHDGVTIGKAFLDFMREG